MAKITVIYFDIQTGFVPDLHHGLASLAAAASYNGHIFELYHLREVEDPDLLADQILSGSPDVVGFSFTTNQYTYLERYSKAISRKHDVLQIAGGTHPTLSPEDVLKLNTIDAVCIGEGEKALTGLLDCIENKQPFLNTLSLWFRSKSNSTIRNALMPLSNLSDLSYPDYSIFDVDHINKYNSGWMNMMIARGCPYNCSYCCNHAIRSKYVDKANYVRVPSIDYAIGLIKNNLNNYPNVKGIIFVDDLLFLNTNWLVDFLKKYRQEISKPFICNARVEQIDEQVSGLLKKSGCVLVRMGIESGNEWVRRYLLNRQQSNDQIIRAFSALKRQGLSTFSYNIVGLPFETKEQMRETFIINKKVKPDQGAVFYFFPYPGTKLFEICNTFGLIYNKSKNKTNYLDGPAIKLTHCSEKDCRKAFQNIKFYLLLRSAKKKMGYWVFAFVPILILFPNYIIKKSTERSVLKDILRKKYYNILHDNKNK